MHFFPPLREADSWLQSGKVGRELCDCSWLSASWQWTPKGCFLELCWGENCLVPPGSISTCSSPSIAPTVPFPFCSQLRAWCDTLTRHLPAQLRYRRGLVALTRMRNPFAGWSWRSRVVPAGARQAHAGACSASRRMSSIAWCSWLAEAWYLRQHSRSGMGRGQQELSVGCQHKVSAETTCCKSQQYSGFLWALVRYKAGRKVMNYLLSSKHFGSIWKEWC